MKRLAHKRYSIHDGYYGAHVIWTQTGPRQLTRECVFFPTLVAWGRGTMNFHCLHPVFSLIVVIKDSVLCLLFSSSNVCQIYKWNQTKSKIQTNDIFSVFLLCSPVIVSSCSMHSCIFWKQASYIWNCSGFKIIWYSSLQKLKSNPFFLNVSSF